MTEPTDDEIATLYAEQTGFALDDSPAALLDFARAVLAKWGTPPAVAKWAPEELSDGKRGIRWVTEDGIHGRPTDHDVREYLKRTPTAHGCHCDECKQFYTAQQPTQAQAGAVPLTLRWCAHCGEGVTNFCRSKPAGDCPIGLPRIKGGQHVGKVD